MKPKVKPDDNSRNVEDIIPIEKRQQILNNLRLV